MVHVFFDDVTDAGTGRRTGRDVQRSTTSRRFDRAHAHTARFSITFVPGAGNDVVKIYIDGGPEGDGHLLGELLPLRSRAVSPSQCRADDEDAHLPRSSENNLRPG